MDRKLIDRYAAGADVPAREIAGLSPEQLNAHPVPGTWSIQQIVLHLMDSDLIGADRMKRVIAEDHPTLIGYDQTKYAAGLFYDQLDAHMAADVFAKNRRLMAEILHRLPDEAFARTGHHNENGEMTLADFLKIYVEHLEHHAKFIHDKRMMVKEI